MTEGTTGSTVPRRQLGRYLRDLRNQAGLTVRAAAKALEWSEPKIWRIETGQTSMRSLDVEQMCRIYGCEDSELIKGLMSLAKETKARGWWHSYDDAIQENSNLDLYIGLEEAANELNTYQPEVVPGLCQTAAYAREVIRAHRPNLEDDTVDRRVQLRINRQHILHRAVGAPRASFVINEVLLRRPLGRHDIMTEQFDHLVKMAELPAVRLRVIPFAAGFHPGALTGGFVTLRFAGPGNGSVKVSEPPTVYVESFTGALYLDQPKEIDRYDAAFESIWSSSLDERASIELIKQAAMELRK